MHSDDSVGCTTAGRTLEKVADEKDTESAAVVQGDHIEDVDSHDSDQHLWSKEKSARLPRTVGGERKGGQTIGKI